MNDRSPQPNILPTPEDAILGRRRSSGLGWRRLIISRTLMWASFGYFIVQAIRLGTRLYLTHLIAPEAFGLFVIVGAVITGGQMLTDVGILPSVVHNPRGEERSFLRTALSVQAARGLVVAAIVASLGTPAAMLYDLPELGLMLPVAAIGLMLLDFRSPRIYVQIRNRNLAGVTCLEVAAEIIAMVGAVCIAIFAPSAWALIIPGIIVNLVLAVGSHTIFGGPMLPGWDRSAARDLLRFGSVVFLSTATWFLASEGERLYLPLWISIEAVGILALGLFFTNFVSRGIAQVFQRVTFPALAAQARTDPLAADAGYRQAQHATALLALFIVIGFAAAPPALRLVLGGNFEAAASLAPILGLRAAFEVNQRLSSALLLAHGRVMVQVVANLTRAALMLVCVPLGVTWAGLEGAAWALVISAAIPSFIFSAGVVLQRPTLAVPEFRQTCLVFAICIAAALIIVLN